MAEQTSWLKGVLAELEAEVDLLQQVLHRADQIGKENADQTPEEVIVITLKEFYLLRKTNSIYDRPTLVAMRHIISKAPWHYRQALVIELEKLRPLNPDEIERIFQAIRSISSVGLLKEIIVTNIRHGPAFEEIEHLLYLFYGSTNP